MRTTSPGYGYEDAFTIERHGEVTLIEAAPALEKMEPSLVDGAAALVLEPLRHQEAPLVVVDLSRIDYFGSAFLALLIRCWKLATVRGGLMALAGVSPRARELLRMTSLDVVWPLYTDRREAFESLAAN
jgi:anti-sigma B factor antagonist